MNISMEVMVWFKLLQIKSDVLFLYRMLKHIDLDWCFQITWRFSWACICPQNMQGLAGFFFFSFFEEDFDGDFRGDFRGEFLLDFPSKSLSLRSGTGTSEKKKDLERLRCFFIFFSNFKRFVFSPTLGLQVGNGIHRWNSLKREQ